MTVTPSELATQPIGEVAPVAEGIWQLKLPVPFPLRFVSVYLVRGDDGWKLTSAGFEGQPFQYSLSQKQQGQEPQVHHSGDGHEEAEPQVAPGSYLQRVQPGQPREHGDGARERGE